MPRNRIKPFPSFERIQASSSDSMYIISFLFFLLLQDHWQALSPQKISVPLGNRWKTYAKPPWKVLGKVLAPLRAPRILPLLPAESWFPSHSRKPCCFSAPTGLLFSLEPLLSVQTENRAAEGLPSRETGILQFQIPSAVYFTNPSYLIFIAKEAYYTTS